MKSVQCFSTKSCVPLSLKKKQALKILHLCGVVAFHCVTLYWFYTLYVPQDSNCMCFKSLSITCGWDVPASAILCSVSQDSHYILAEQKNLLLGSGLAALPARPFNILTSRMGLSSIGAPQSRKFGGLTQTLHETTWHTALIMVDNSVWNKYHKRTNKTTHSLFGE